ncbi:nucleotidyltransferase domain-containing protein [Ornithinimicrobium cryptoxanthini]|uniref:Nucleotidyltransferase domain-containing protein n=2 Tax=Ornithinimicrobium cryptoxanthini TaxID=2934161 RepID=A0ABY4YNA9_9MICO|nr:nucleotidyltransferase domain-containing protein [Ornithinimicrobium cryptoxanthini]USQ77838.1 nucleotidyltransferase domain-containing protein [Ornithinimicrobium cryptoxanthini]
MSTLESVSHEADKAVRDARARLVAAVRQAAAEGMTQEQIGAAIGRSQPEVSRLLRFHGTGPLGQKVRSARSQILALIRSAGGTNVRIFGSVATGAERPGSDVDLVFTMSSPMSLMELGELEQQVAKVVGADVDLIPESVVRPDLRERVLAEALPL